MLTVILPNYNHGHYLRQCLTALFEQTRPADEIIVIDDASTDDSLDVLREFPVTLLRNEYNRGALACLESGLKIASGDVLYCHSADDVTRPEFFEHGLAMLRAYPEAGICTSWFSVLRDGQIVENANGIRPGYYSPAESAGLFAGTCIPGHATLWRATALDSVGGFLPELHWHCDWFALMVCAARQGVAYVPESLALLRVSENTYSANGRRGEKQREIVRSIVGLLDGRYADVAPWFRQSKAMANLMPELAEVAPEWAQGL